MELAFPDRENFNRTNEGAEKNTRAWDSSVTVNVMRAANRFSSDFTPQFQDWLEIGLGPAAEAMADKAFQQQVGRSKDQAKRELEATTSIVQAVFNGPGFPTAANELYIDWHFGQGGMKIMPNDDQMGEPVVFSSVPLSHFYAYEGPNGQLDRWFFWHELRADAVEQEWSDATIPPELREIAAREKPEQVKVASVVYRDYQAQDRQYRYEVFWQKGNDCHRIVERAYRTPAFVTPRYSKLAGENRGRGPVLFAIADIRTANKIVEMTLKAVSIAVSGIYTAEENGVLSPVAIKPLSVIRVRRNGGQGVGASLQRLDSPQRIDFGQVVLEQLQENIKKVIGDNSLPSEAGPIRTATEFIQRARELISDQAGGLGRLHAEFIVPAVQRVVDILETRQILPTDGLKIDQFLIEVRMKSPLAQAQAMQEVENIVRFVEMLKMLGGDELAATEVSLDRAPGMIAELMSVPMKARTTDEEKAEIKKSMAQVAAQQMGGDPNAAGQVMDERAARG